MRGQEYAFAEGQDSQEKHSTSDSVKEHMLA